eukprot:9090245-Lingulodinium_polyedra.AAC.1
MNITMNTTQSSKPSNDNRKHIVATSTSKLLWQQVALSSGSGLGRVATSDHVVPHGNENNNNDNHNHTRHDNNHNIIRVGIMKRAMAIRRRGKDPQQRKRDHSIYKNINVSLNANVGTH